MSKKYIEREAARKVICDACGIYDDCLGEDRCGVMDGLDKIPAADVVEVVRCKDCKWFAEDKWCRNPNNDMVQGGTTGEWFCAGGERKGGDGDE